MTYIRSLDGVRAVAILLVIYFHFFYLLECGWIGVQLFFVLSGYLITGILLDFKNLGLSQYLKRFYWRRMLRIFPLYYFYIGIVLLVFFIFQVPHNFLGVLPYLFTYSYNLEPFFEGFKIDTFFTHFWSLAVEEQFYIFWPFVIYFFSTNSLRLILIIIIFFSPIVRYGLGVHLISDSFHSSDVIGQLIYRFTPGQLDSFALGAVIPIFNLTKIEIRSNLIFYSIFIIFLALGIVNLLTMHGSYGLSSLGYPNGSMQNYQHIWSYSIINLTFSSFILYLVCEGKSNQLVRIFLCNPLMVGIGKISYGMYVYHWILLAIYRKTVNPLIQNNYLSSLIFVILVLLISYLSYIYFEKRFLDFKDKLGT